MSRLSTAGEGRRAAIRSIHANARELGMNADARHGLQERLTGKASLTEMSDAELEVVKRELWQRRRRAGPARHRMPRTPTASKLRALWIAAWNLGVVEDRSDRALAAFTRRQLNIDSLTWSAPILARAVEALKLWLARPVGTGGGGVVWSGRDGSGRAPPEVARADVLRAQWHRLHDLGLVEIRDEGGLCQYVARLIAAGVRSVEHLSADEADAAMRHFGDRIRERLGDQP
ncbi:MAG: regulatory protein GemA [Alphaproteobacteria bacterium]|nr:regulatory protein GemA [Alphaproteobacteria bacterium]